MYIDAILDREKEIIQVVERTKDGRNFVNYPAKYIFYYDDPKGKYTSIYGSPVSRVACRSRKELNREVAIHSQGQIYESDFNPIFRCLADNYLNCETPKLQVGFIDIEVGFNERKGFSPPSDPFNEVTAITIYYRWLEDMITLALPPPGMGMDQAEDLLEGIPNCHLFSSEDELLGTFLDLIEDCDIISGWNSEGYDLPYLVNRITRVLSKDDTRRFCLWNQLPKKRQFERFGKTQETYDIVGRVHLDYLQLYKKYTYEERHSYSLDAIGEHELKERKVQYEGTLDELYRNDFRKFIEYNRQDTELLHKLDLHLGFMDLANQHGHDCTVLFPTVMGTVGITEQAIINEVHSRGMVVPNRKEHPDTGNAAGAYVAKPKTGIHEWIGSVDINSLYPSAIRALNMTIETIVGQLRPTYTDELIQKNLAAQLKYTKTPSVQRAWEGVFATLEYDYVMNKDETNMIWVDWESGESEQMTGSELYGAIFQSKDLMISANGTIFRADIEGIIPVLLSKWYSERKELQAKLTEVKNNPNSTKEEIAYWDKRQLVKKINLNSLYGALLNVGCRFFDKRIGQSTTLTGRTITKHMDAHLNEQVTGDYDHLGKSIVYGDTDSCYFSIWPLVKDKVNSGQMEWNHDIAVEIYDAMAEEVNDSFPEFMKTSFNCTDDRASIIKCGREIVARTGLYIKKKRYAALVYDNEGTRLDLLTDPEDIKKTGTIQGVGKVKTTGLDLRRSDTPKFMQAFLLEILTDVLTGKDEDFIADKIKEFKIKFKDRPGWEKGTPKSVNKLTHYRTLEDKSKDLGGIKANLPGHVRAALNWNTLRNMYSDNRSMEIVDGQKIIVCKLKNNPMGYTSVAYPVDQPHLPQWFKDLPFDHELMASTIVDQKVNNLLGVLKWDLESKTNVTTTFGDLFDF